MSSNKRRRVMAKDGEERAPVVAAVAKRVTTAAIEPELDEIPKLVLVDLHKNDSSAVKQALKRMDKLLPIEDDEEDSDELQDRRQDLIRTGAVAMVVLTMQKWRGNKKIQEHACRFLGHFQYYCRSYEDGGYYYLEDTLAKAGGIEAVLTAIQAFPNSLKVCRAGCWTLSHWNWLVPLQDDLVPGLWMTISRRFIEEWNGLQIIKTTMKAFPQDGDLQAWCCGIFDRLAHQKDFRKALIDAGLISSVGAALETHSEHQWVKVYGGEFMTVMFGNDEQRNDEEDNQDEEDNEDLQDTEDEEDSKDLQDTEDEEDSKDLQDTEDDVEEDSKDLQDTEDDDDSKNEGGSEDDYTSEEEFCF
jgi:hypothetical protein